MKKISEWSRERIKAELDGLGQRLLDEGENVEPDEAHATPNARDGCICRNRHEADKDGLIFTAPNCPLHGLQTPAMGPARDSGRPVGRPWMSRNFHVRNLPKGYVAP